MECLYYKKWFIVVVLTVLFVNVMSSFSFAQEESVDKPAELFLSNCAGCHTVGGGDLIGPDLKEATQWSNEDLRSAIKRMEENTGPMTESDINQLLEFLKDLNVSERIQQQQERQERVEAKPRTELPKASFETGQQLFRGNKPLANRGPSCFACHHFVNEGGSLGPDLTHLNKSFSSAVLQSAIEKSSYKVMRPIYEKKPITQEEALHLAEYLSHPEKVKPRLFVVTAHSIIIFSAVGFTAFFVLIWIMNKKRKGPTREKLVRNYKLH